MKMLPPAVYISGFILCVLLLFLKIILVSEAPKEAPVRKYLPSSVYLEEKTDEQKKEEVKMSSNTVHLCLLLYSYCGPLWGVCPALSVSVTQISHIQILI